MSTFYTTFLYISDFSFALLLVTFEPLDIQQSYIPLLKALMYGISVSGAQGRDSTLSICHGLLKNAVLLSEIAKRLTFKLTFLHHKAKIWKHTLRFFFF